jgi:hypothetical protein
VCGVLARERVTASSVALSLVSSTEAHVRVLHRYHSPRGVDLSQNAGTDAGALGFVNVAIIWNSECIIAMSGARKRTCITGVSGCWTGMDHSRRASGSSNPNIQHGS